MSATHVVTVTLATPVMPVRDEIRAKAATTATTVIPAIPVRRAMPVIPAIPVILANTAICATPGTLVQAADLRPMISMSRIF